jgi:hypothetical protein
MKRSLPFHSSRVWPPLIGLIPFLIMYGMLVGSMRLIEVFVGAPFGLTDNLEEVRNIETGLLAVAAGVYGIYRVWRFHPRLNFSYLNWLRLTPWTAAKPLPLGPVHLVWQDLLAVGVLTAIVKWQLHGIVFVPLVAFGSAYLALITLVLLLTRRWPECVVLGFLWPALLLPQLNATGFGLVIVAIVVVTGYGHYRSLREFPWSPRDQPMNPPESILRKQIQPISATGAPAHVGWPMTAIGPKIKVGFISKQTAFWLGALFGWWSYCWLERDGEKTPPEFIIMFAMIAAFLRFAIYCSYAVAPFNIWGRIASGRLIVPGFDKVLLTPLAVTLISIAGAIIVHHSGAWYSEVESVVIALCWFVLLNGGPSRKNWVLTGYVRFKSPLRTTKKGLPLRQV